MSHAINTDHDSKNNKMNPEEYGKALGEVQGKEKDSAQELLALEERLLQFLEKVKSDIYEEKQWLQQHKAKWYDPTSWFAHRADREKMLAADEAEESKIEKELATVMKELDALFNSSFSGPLHMLDLKVNHLFKELTSHGGNISQKLLEDVMSVMSEVMAIVQMILAQTDNDKGHQESLIGRITSLQYKEQVDETNADIQDYIEQIKKAGIMKIVSTVIKVVLCVAAIALAVATGGVCSVLVAVIIAAVVMSGASDKLTEVIAKKLKEDGASNTASKILADVIVTAIMTVATLGVGTLSALGEGALTSALSNTMSSTMEEVTENAINESVEQAMSTISQDASEAATNAASSAAKTVASEVATTAGRSAMKDALRAVLKQALASTLKQSMTTAGRETLSESIKSSVREAVQQAMTEAQEQINNVASQAASNVEEELETEAAEAMTQEAAENAASGQDTRSATSRSLSSLKVSRAIANGIGIGVMGTNLVGDSLGGLLQLILGKKIEKKEWYKDLMEIVQVIQTILALVMMMKYGGEMVDNENVGPTEGKSNRASQIANFGLTVGGVAQGAASFAQGVISEKEAGITEGLAGNKQAILILNYLVQEMNQMIKDEQRHESEELKDETQSTITTINALNQGLEGYAHVLGTTNV